MIDTFSKPIIYTGPSMNPTLKTGDMLEVIPYNGKKIKPGDVVVFVPPQGSKNIVHRVVSLDSGFIQTRGDNNNRLDSWLLTSHDVLGKVIYAYKGKKRFPIYGGKIGRIYAFYRIAVLNLKSGIRFPLRPIYWWLVKSALLNRLFAGLFKLKLVYFNRPGGQELQLRLGSFLVGRKLAGRKTWRIRRPFRLFIDPRYNLDIKKVFA
jgi:signal peptidase I